MNGPITLLFLGFGVNSLDPDDHHARIDSRRDPSDEAKGYSLRSWQDPLLVPVMVFSPNGSGMTLWLSDDQRELTRMLGLDATPAPPPAPRKPRRQATPDTYRRNRKGRR